MVNYSLNDVVKIVMLYNETKYLESKGCIRLNFNTQTFEEAINLLNRYIEQVPKEIRNRLDINAEGLLKKLNE